MRTASTSAKSPKAAEEGKKIVSETLSEESQTKDPTNPDFLNRLKDLLNETTPGE